jgi:hypothetical protein
MSWLGEAIHQISWASAGGVLFGAAISASVSFVLQRSSFAEARRQKDKDRSEIRKVYALSLVFKMIRISSDLNNLGKSVRESIELGRKNDPQARLFQFVPPTIPLPDKVRFSPDEMAWVLSVNNRLFNEMAPLDELHTNTVAIFELYNTKRDNLLEKLGAQMEGTIGTTFLTPEQKRWFDPRAVELDQLVEVMVQRSLRDSQGCWQAFEQLTAAVSKEFNMNLSFERKSGT